MEYTSLEVGVYALMFSVIVQVCLLYGSEKTLAAKYFKHQIFLLS